MPSSLKHLVGGQQLAKVNAITRKLNQRGLIKTLPSVLKGGKKVWMLMEIEAREDVTGGLAGSDYFDLESISEVINRVESFARKQG